ncbi:hypothetical protein D1841_07985 [Neglecta sp. X4]|nr:hypothetical protein [Neglectibacter sp. 59]NBJ73250.1 hypothetical protein [Neglectibacter sp. X4]NCE81134.1 hypothetical protein [Neglectibacter sp. X58]
MGYTARKISRKSKILAPQSYFPWKIADKLIKGTAFCRGSALSAEILRGADAGPSGPGLPDMNP